MWMDRGRFQVLASALRRTQATVRSWRDRVAMRLGPAPLGNAVTV